MTDLEQLLVRDLEARADRVPVGPAPVDLMLRQAASRRRRPLVVLAAAAAVAVVAGGLAVVVPGTDSGEAPPAAPSPTATESPRPVVAEQYVGHGRVVVPVPDGWGDPRADRCGTPRADAVVDHRITGRDCVSERPDGVETIEVLGPLEQYDPFPTLDYAPRRIEIDGEPADRSPAFCDRSSATCRVSVWVRSPGVQVVASASTQASADALADTVEVLPEDGVDTKRVGVGHLSVAVPAGWSRNDLSCSTPQSDGYVDQEAFRACAVPRLEGVESVRVLLDAPQRTGREVVLGGEIARWVDPVCELSDPPFCQATVWVPSAGVGVAVESSTGPDEVAAILETLAWDPTSVAVPRAVTDAGVPISPDAYLDRLAAVGLVGDLRAEELPVDLRVSEVVPASGTVVPVGSTVELDVEPWRDSDKGRS